jgi:hypothetical protein
MIASNCWLQHLLGVQHFALLGKPASTQGLASPTGILPLPVRCRVMKKSTRAKAWIGRSR